ncbi:MAG TPA: hypothetical protein ENJ32_06515 [Crenotrichaceae bacterium]|nr:hypothetical protein [Crenotrichaceae bacterium]
MYPNSILILLVVAVLSLFHPHVDAELSGSISGTTDYIGYGYTKSDGNPAIQANLDYEHTSGIFLGVSVSSVDFGDHQFGNRSRVEVAPYLGWHYELSPDWRFEIQWLRYLYDDRIFGAVADYNLFSTTLHYQDLVTARLSFSDDLYQQDETGIYYELSGRYPVSESIEFSTDVGYSQTRDALEYDYLYWDAGLTWFHPYGSLDFRYFQSKFFRERELDKKSKWLFDPHEIDAKFVFTISFGF